MYAALVGPDISILIPLELEEPIDPMPLELDELIELIPPIPLELEGLIPALAGRIHASLIWIALWAAADVDAGAGAAVGLAQAETSITIARTMNRLRIFIFDSLCKILCEHR
jgi:hypothetical protein